MAEAATTEPLVQLGNQSFMIGFDASDDARRRAYYRDGVGELTEQEQLLLNSLGFDKMLESAMAPHLPKFFMSLSKCSNDTAIHLRRECELPYFVIWSALFNNQEETRRRMEENQRATKEMSDLSDAMTRALIQNIHAARMDLMTQLFTLMVLPERETAAATSFDAVVRELFTLKLVEPIE
jgi:hypothetical protein